MSNWRALVIPLAVFLQPLAALPQSADPIPPALYQKWRKHGPWDYKQQSFQYRDYTLFNFGASGSAAGFDQRSLIALSRSSKPKPEDFDSFADAQLQDNLARNVDAFEMLRKMSEKDAHVIRIAPDFTWLDGSSAWPRKDLGFSEERWNEYRSLFKKLSLAEGVVRTQDFPETVFLVARARGLCTGGSSQGYAFSTKPLSPLVESPKEGLMSEMQKNPDRHYAFVFKPLRANWYAFYEADW